MEIEKEQNAVDEQMEIHCKAVLDLRDKVESIIESSTSQLSDAFTSFASIETQLPEDSRVFKDEEQADMKCLVQRIFGELSTAIESLVAKSEERAEE